MASASGTQTVTTKPSKRGKDAKKIWKKFMSSLGDMEGEEGVFQQREEYLKPHVEGYADTLSQAINQDTGLLTPQTDWLTPQHDLLKQQGISIGGGNPINFVPRSNVLADVALNEGNLNAAKALNDINRKAVTTESQINTQKANMAAKKLGALEEYGSGYGKAKLMNLLQPMAMNLETLRYGLPGTQTTSGSLEEEPSVLSELGQVVDIGSAVWDTGKSIYDTFFG